MSRTLILTLAAAATIAVASFASSASYARGGGWRRPRRRRRSRRWRPCRWRRTSVVAGMLAEVAAMAADVSHAAAITPVTVIPVTVILVVVTLAVGPAIRADTGFSVAVAGSLSTRWLAEFRRDAAPCVRGHSRPRPVHLPDQDLHAGWSGGVRGCLHQGSSQRASWWWGHVRRYPGAAGQHPVQRHRARLAGCRRDPSADHAELRGYDLPRLLGGELAGCNAEELKTPAIGPTSRIK